VAEWLNAAVLKTAEPDKGSVGSNPTLSESQHWEWRFDLRSPASERHREPASSRENFEELYKLSRRKLGFSFGIVEHAGRAREKIWSHS
jgi:hypothetical protein